MPETIVQLSNVFLKSDRGTTIFRDLSFALESGRSAVIYGPAGSGKTVLAELMVGLRFPDGGAVELFGELIKRSGAGRVRRLRRKIGGVGGPFDLLPGLTLAENIALPMILAGERRRAIKERLTKLLGEFSLLGHAQEYPHQLTRIERTLSLLARASSAHQPLLLVDEPLAGLDRRAAGLVFDYLAQAVLSGRSVIVFASDQLPAELSGARTFRIDDGALV